MTSMEQQNIEREGLAVQDLTSILEASGIDTSTWGIGVAKTVAQLLEEIRAGESKVSLSPEGTANRIVKVAWVDVLYFDDHGRAYQLYEDRQEYSDGRTRNRQLSSSLGEKFKPDEQPYDAAARALHEELGITSVDSLHAIGSEATVHTPDSYPGLQSQYDTYSFVAVLDDASFSPDGYIEVQADKTNYYLWKPL